MRKFCQRGFKKFFAVAKWIQVKLKHTSHTNRHTPYFSPPRRQTASARLHSYSPCLCNFILKVGSPQLQKNVLDSLSGSHADSFGFVKILWWFWWNFTRPGVFVLPAVVTGWVQMLLQLPLSKEWTAWGNSHLLKNQNIYMYREAGGGRALHKN